MSWLASAAVGWLPSPAVLVAIAAIFGVLTFATVASAVLARLKPGLDLAEVDTRIRT